MGRLSASLSALGLAVVAALALSACGGGGADLLPGGTASEINSNLDRVQQLVGEGDCIGAEDAAQEVSAQVDALGGVDKQLKQALAEGAERLNEVVDGCEEASEEESAEPVEAVEEAEPVEEKPEKQKPKKQAEKEEEAEEPAEETTPSLPPQANGKAEGLENGNGNAPPEEADEAGEGGGTPSGGVGPGTPAAGG